MPKTVLISGGAGYIGSSLTTKLLNQGYAVRVLDRCFFGRDSVEQHIGSSNFTLIKADIRYADKDLFRGVDVVCELSGLSNDPSCDLDPALTFEINHKGAVRMAKLAKECGVRRFIFSSSCSIYGHGANEDLSEESPKNPVSHYAKAKLMAEEEINNLDDNNFTVTSLRQATAYGISKRMRFDLVINMMTLYALKKGKIYIMGGGNQWRPIIHLDDIVKAFIMAMEAPEEKVKKQIFNVGSNEQNFQIHQIAKMIKKVMPGVAIEIVPDDPDKRTYRVNFDKICKDLGFRAEKNPIDGISEVRDGLLNGLITDDIKTRTVDYYRYLLNVEKVFKEVSHKDSIF